MIHGKTRHGDRSLNRLIEVMYTRLFDEYYILFKRKLMHKATQGRNVLRKRLDETDLKRIESNAFMLADENTKFHLKHLGLTS